MKNYILIIALLLVGCAREKPISSAKISEGTNTVYKLQSAANPILQWQSATETGNWERHVFVTEYATNLVIHSPLIPVVSKTNDTYYIEFKKHDYIVMSNLTVYANLPYNSREQRVQEQADAIIRAMTNADVIAAWKPKPEPSYAPPQIYTMPPFNWSTNGWMKGGTNFYLQNMGSHEERL